MSELREAAQAVVNYHDSVLENNTPDALIDRLRAALVAAREREACAELVEKGAWAGCWIEETRELSEEVAEAIRARAEKETA